MWWPFSVWTLRDRVRVLLGGVWLCIAEKLAPSLCLVLVLAYLVAVTSGFIQ